MKVKYFYDIYIFASNYANFVFASKFFEDFKYYYLK